MRPGEYLRVFVHLQVGILYRQALGCQASVVELCAAGEAASLPTSGTRFSPEGVGSRMDWRHRAACLTEDPELFFPVGNTGPALMQIQEAKKVCKRCDVREACLQWALDAGQDHGVWGGLSEDER